MNDTHLSGMDRVVTHKRPYKQYIVLAACAAVLSVVLYVLGKNTFTKTASADGQRIVLSTVRTGVFSDSIPITGNIVPIATIYLDAVEGGQVVQVHVDEGDRVSAGDPLVTLENTNLQLEVIGREAQLTEQINSLLATELSIEQNRLSYKQDLIGIDYKLELLELKLERLRSVAGAGGVAKEELDNAGIERTYYARLHEAVGEAQSVNEKSQNNQRNQLKTAVESMTANLEIASRNLKNLVIKAPISGQLTMLEANLGESLPKGQRVGQIDEVDQYKVAALVDEFYLGRLAAGQLATVDIAGSPYTLKVTKIYPEVRNRQFEIDLAFQEKPAKARLGQTLRMALDIGSSVEGSLFDYGAFYEDTGGHWVYVVEPSGDSAVRRQVTLGRQNGKQVEVLEGLAPGESVISSGYKDYGDAQRVEIR